MIDQSVIDKLTKTLAGPWPSASPAAAHLRLKEAFDIFIHNIPSPTTDPRPAQLLQALPDHAWWTLFLGCKKLYGWDDIHPCLVVEKDRRLACVHADPSVLSNVLAATHPGAPAEQMWCGLIAALLDDTHWPASAPASLAPITTVMIQNAHKLGLSDDTVGGHLGGIWGRLCYQHLHPTEHVAADPQALDRATEQMWGVLPTSTHLFAWSTLAVVWGHDPKKLSGVFSPDHRSTEERTKALIHLTECGPLAKPMDVALVQRLAQDVPAKTLGVILADLSRYNHPEKWFSEVVSLLWDQAQLDEPSPGPPGPGQDRPLVTIIRNMGIAGKTATMTMCLARANALPIIEATEVVGGMSLQPEQSFPNTFVAFMNTQPIETHPTLLAVACDLGSVSGPWPKNMAQGLAQCWSQLSEPHASDLITKHPELLNIPILRACYDQRDMTHHVDHPLIPRAPTKKM